MQTKVFSGADFKKELPTITNNFSNMDPNNIINPGGLQDKIDQRDYQWADFASSNGIASYNWNEDFDIEEVLKLKIPTKNQNGSSSCGGQAWSYYLSVIEAIDDGSFEERSAKYIYEQVFVSGGGAYGRDCSDLCVKQGVAREALCSSYYNGRPPSEEFMQKTTITQEMRADASKDKALKYAQVGLSIDEVAQAIKANRGVVIGVNGSNNGTWGSLYPKPPADWTKTEWRHWIYAGKVKTINGKRYIGVKNSWGAIGENGWQYLGEEWFNGSVFNVWTLTFLTNKNTMELFKKRGTEDLFEKWADGKYRKVSGPSYVANRYGSGLKITEIDIDNIAGTVGEEEWFKNTPINNW